MLGFEGGNFFKKFIFNKNLIIWAKNALISYIDIPVNENLLTAKF